MQLWEKKLDTKALMAWNHDTVVLSFRGTASFKNVLADIKARCVLAGPAVRPQHVNQLCWWFWSRSHAGANLL